MIAIGDSNARRTAYYGGINGKFTHTGYKTSEVLNKFLKGYDKHLLDKAPAFFVFTGMNPEMAPNAHNDALLIMKVVLACCDTTRPVFVAVPFGLDQSKKAEMQMATKLQDLTFWKDHAKEQIESLQKQLSDNERYLIARNRIDLIDKRDLQRRFGILEKIARFRNLSDLKIHVIATHVDEKGYLKEQYVTLKQNSLQRDPLHMNTEGYLAIVEDYGKILARHRASRKVVVAPRGQLVSTENRTREAVRQRIAARLIQGQLATEKSREAVMQRIAAQFAQWQLQRSQPSALQGY